MRLLIVEDFAPLREALSQGLIAEGFAVDVSGDGEEGLWFSTHNEYDLIILDLMLPRLNGLGLLSRLRGQSIRIPVLILTAKDSIEDRIMGLDQGADDYLIKPFALGELLARVRSLVRRGHSQYNPIISIDDLEIDTTSRLVRRYGQDIALTPREYALLHYLALKQNHVVTRTQIWEHLYEFAADSSSNVIDAHISRLRRKLISTGRKQLIHTHRGHGFILSIADPHA